MRRFRIHVAYLGTNYHGWQIQASDRTVQGVLESVLAQILDRPEDGIRVTGAGRTDSEVHARHQVAHFDIEREDRTPLELKKGLNGLTESDIWVRRLEEVDNEFHARFSAGDKTYQYRLWNDSRPHPIWDTLTWHVHPDIDFARLEDGAERLIGTHDFEAFRASDCQSETSVRTIRDIRVRDEGSFAEIEVIGSGFLKYMVRTIAGTLVDVGIGASNPEIVERMFETGERKLGGMTAPGKGLILDHIDYPGWEWNTEVAELGKIGLF